MSGTSSNEMSRRKRDKARSGADTAWLGFVDITLTDADKASLSEGHFEDSDAFDFMQELVDDGYKVTLSPDAAHSSCIATATGRLATNVNNGYSLSGRGPDVIGALAALAYKHINLCERGVWTNFSGSSTASKWG